MRVVQVLVLQRRVNALAVAVAEPARTVAMARTLLVVLAVQAQVTLFRLVQRRHTQAVAVAEPITGLRVPVVLEVAAMAGLRLQRTVLRVQRTQVAVEAVLLVRHLALAVRASSSSARSSAVARLV